MAGLRRPLVLCFRKSAGKYPPKPLPVAYPETGPGRTAKREPGHYSDFAPGRVKQSDGASAANIVAIGMELPEAGKEIDARPRCGRMRRQETSGERKTRMQARSRAALGGMVGALCVLPFYQGLWTACAKAGLRLQPYPAAGVPLVVTLAVTGGTLGAVFGLLLPALRRPGWQCGAMLGGVVTVLLWFIVVPLTGAPVAGGFHAVRMLQTLTINVAWGVSVGLLVSLLQARQV
jgi:hypothetical protein